MLEVSDRIPDKDSAKQLLSVMISTIFTLRPQIVPVLEEAYSPNRRRPRFDPFLLLVVAIFRSTTWSYREICRELTREGDLFRLIGLSKFPSPQLLSLFVRRLGYERLQRISVIIIREIQKFWPDFGQVISIDGTTVRAYARNDKGLRSSSDPDATWGYKEHNKKKEPKWMFGYRPIIVTEAQYEVPMTGDVTSAKDNESPFLIPLLKLTREIGIPLDVVVADAMYDSLLNLHVAILFHMRPVIVLNPRSSKTAKATGKRKSDWILPITRNSDEWKRFLRMRNASEHVNKSLKFDVGLNTLTLRGLARVKAFFWLCMLAKQLMAFSAARIGRPDLADNVTVWRH